MYYEFSDDRIDAMLRDVPVPDGLVSRLQAVVVPGDDELDEALVDVAAPVGFLDRLKQTIDNELIDEAINNVEPPDDLMPRLRVIPWQRPHRPMRRMALAASLLLVALGTYFTAIGGILAAIRPAEARLELDVINFGPIEVRSEQIIPVELVADETPRAVMPTEVAVPRLPPVLLVRFDATYEPLPPGPAGELFHDLDLGLDLESNVFFLRWGPLASPQRIDAPMPELERTNRSPVRGVDLPLVDGYDRSFLLTSGAHPPCFPGIEKSLTSIDVPLGHDIDSVRRTARLLAEGRRPRPHEVRVEDFVAAIDYDYPPPEQDALRIHTTAGPSPFAKQPHQLLQIGVKAKQVGSAREGGTHVAIAVDTSMSMGWDGRLSSVQAALTTTLKHLSEDDSLSLVAFHHEITGEVDLATRANQNALHAAIAALQPSGGDNLVAGLQRALTLALETRAEDDLTRQLVLITDAQSPLDGDQLDRLTDLLETARRYDLAVTLLNVDDLSPPTRDLASLATRGLLTLKQTTHDRIAWDLLEQVSDRAALVAKNTRLSVTFNPEAVTAYRLVGHGPTAITGLESAPMTAELHSGEEATALFEVWLRDNGVDNVASATLHWTDPTSGEHRSVPTQQIDRDHFTMDADHTPSSLQAAAVAAEVGIRLRDGYDFHVNRKRATPTAKSDDWRDLLEHVDGMPQELSNRSDIQRLRDVIRRLDLPQHGPPTSEETWQ